MSIRLSLLAILDQGECYGYQLRAEFERRTGGSWPLNVGQVYATLDRLERDGLATKSAVDGTGHVNYSITPQGSAEVAEWLAAPVEPGRDEFAIKLALAITLPGADAHALIAAQRAALREAAAPAETPAAPLEQRLVSDARAFAAEAQLRWLDHCEALIAGAEPYGLESESPRRGRPVRATAV
jgi:DNA-binding PadR family transcriptional regulator